MVQLPPSIQPLLINGGTIEPTEKNVLRLNIPSHSRKYCDAQIDDYHHLLRKDFLWLPPCRMQLRARASHPQPLGTLGFGFWNDPFTISIGQGGASRRFPATPKTIWFFYGSRENDIRLNPSLPGNGWKAVSIDSPNIPTLLLAPAAVGAITCSYIPLIRPLIMDTARRFLTVEETMLESSLDQWHTYTIDWTIEKVVFYVDEKEVLEVKEHYSGPLGFVAWIDNQFAVASPDNHFYFGVVPTIETQWLELDIKYLERT